MSRSIKAFLGILAAYAIIVALVMSVVSMAHATPPATALVGTINSRPVALYSGPAGFAEACFIFEWQLPNGTWETPFSPLGCGNISQSAVDAAGGPVPFITSWLPYINPSIAGAFAGDGGINAQLNTSLTTAFKFTGNSSSAVGPK